MFNNSKYGNLLTVILIIAVVAIIGIIGTIGYKIYNIYYNKSGALDAATEFEQSVQNSDNAENTIQDGNSNIVINGIGDTFTDNTTTGGKGQATKYKGFDVIGTIQIPAINLKYPILEKNTKKSLETSVVLMYTANGINEVGNTVIIGHNYRNGTMFSNVKKLEKGDVIYITDLAGRKVKYTVYDKYRTSGNDGKYITRNTNGKREISLSTCTDDSKARTIVLAKEN